MTDHTTQPPAARTARRALVTLAAGAALVAATAGSALANPGTPGSTFPEQPGTSLSSGCNAILTNPNNAYTNRAPSAAGIVYGLTVDACFNG